MKRLEWTQRRRTSPRSRTSTGSEQAAWVRAQELTTTTVRWAMWAGIVAGALALLLIVLGVGRSTQPVAVRHGADADLNSQAAAQEFARQCVLVWLQAKRGEEQSVEPCFPTTRLQLPAAPAYIASDAAIAGIEDTAKPPAGAVTGTPSPTPTMRGPARKTYSVTVAVTARGAQDPPSAASRRYFAVPVVLVDGVARAATLPAEVAAPPVTEDVALGYRAAISSDHPVSGTVLAFLRALAAGDGEVSRYVSPDMVIRPITPAPYASVELVDLAGNQDITGDRNAPADGRRLQVLATAELRIDDTHAVTAQYALTMTARGGRWEVAALDPVPLLPPGRAASTPSSSPRPDSTATTTPSPTVTTETTRSTTTPVLPESP